MLAVLSGRRHVLLGEKHDNPRHHSLQARVLAGLVTAGRRPAVVWEMITPYEGEALHAHLADHPDDAVGLGAALRWEKRGWPPWKLYQPIAAVMLPAGLSWVPGGVPRSELMKLAHPQGGGDADPQGRASRSELLPPPLEDALARSLEGAHCGHASKKMVRMMALAQQLRDWFMADQLARWGADQGSVLIAGKGHARRDYGVPYFLEHEQHVGREQIVSVAFIEVDAEHTRPGQYAAASAEEPAFDFIWFTERVDSVDPCEKYKDQLRRIPRH